jgi:hypothetical protein
METDSIVHLEQQYHYLNVIYENLKPPEFKDLSLVLYSTSNLIVCAIHLIGLGKSEPLG